MPDVDERRRLLMGVLAELNNEAVDKRVRSRAREAPSRPAAGRTRKLGAGLRSGGDATARAQPGARPSLLGSRV